MKPEATEPKCSDTNEQYHFQSEPVASMGTNQATIDLIRAHTLNELRHSPESVTAHDRLFLLDEIERLREDLRALAHFVLGITPDRNTQTDEQVAATEAMIDAIALEALNV